MGQAGERAALGILGEEGYRVLQINFATRFGEIDIVAEEGEVLCFVEVRLRTSRQFGSALESLTHYKIRHLRKAAQFYLAAVGHPERDCRFDFLALDWDRLADSPRSHILVRNAFEADD